MFLIRFWQRHARALWPLLAFCCGVLVLGAPGMSTMRAVEARVDPPASQEIATIPISGAPTNGAWCFESSHVDWYAYRNCRRDPAFGQERERTVQQRYDPGLQRKERALDGRLSVPLSRRRPVAIALESRGLAMSVLDKEGEKCDVTLRCAALALEPPVVMR